MTVQELGKILLCNTPDFEYHGKWYTIDWMDGQFPDIKLYFIPFNCGEDEVQEFDEFGDSRFVEIHWYQEPSVGKVEFKIKIQPDGSWYLDD